MTNKILKCYSINNVKMLKRSQRRWSSAEIDTVPFLLGYRLFSSDCQSNATLSSSTSSQYYRSKSCERRRSTAIGKLSPSNRGRSISKQVIKDLCLERLHFSFSHGGCNHLHVFITRCNHLWVIEKYLYW